jgi:subtilisin family serine protease
MLSGTSMAAPLVAGTAALMFEANPTLTPNMIKTLLMYTAQQLPNYNMFEQGAGELNVDGATRLAKLVRTTINSSTTLGASLLTGPAPSPQTSITTHWRFYLPVVAGRDRRPNICNRLGAHQPVSKGLCEGRSAR